MIQVSYKKKNQDAKSFLYDDIDLLEMGEDIKKLLDDGAEILGVFNK